MCNYGTNFTVFRKNMVQLETQVASKKKLETQVKALASSAMRSEPMN